jgi:capsular polysaccharide biosynthesis protein
VSPYTRSTSPLAAARAHPLWVAATAVVVLAAAVAYGLVRTPTYTAEGRVAITKVDVQTQALPGYALAAQQLASAYARAAQSSTVQSCTARALHLPPGGAGGLSAAPIPQSPIIRVTATAGSAAEAVRLANAGSRCLTGWIRTSAATGSQAPALRRYQDASRLLERRKQLAQDAEDAYSTHKSSSNLRRLEGRRAAVDAQQLVVSSLRAQYTQQTLNIVDPRFVQVLSDASVASGDRSQKLGLLAFSGLIVGLLVGLGLASARAATRTRH